MAKTEAKQHSKQDINLGASNRWQHVLCQVDFNAATELNNRETTVKSNGPMTFYRHCIYIIHILISAFGMFVNTFWLPDDIPWVSTSRCE